MDVIQWFDTHDGTGTWFAGLLTLAAVGLALWQSANNERQERRRRGLLLRAVVMLVDGALLTVQRAKRDLENTESRKYVIAESILEIGVSQSLLAMANDIRLEDVPHYKAMDGLLFLRVCMEHNVRKLVQAATGNFSTADALNGLEDDLQKALPKLEQAWRYYQPLPFLVRIGLRTHQRYGPEG